MSEIVHCQSKVTPARDQVAADLDGEMVILNFQSGVYYGLDAIGARIWDLIQEPRTVGDIRDTLLDEYEVEPDRCEQELLGLLRTLSTAGLIEIRDEACS